MSELAILIQPGSRVSLENGRARVGEIERHLSQEFGMPGIATQGTTIKFNGDQLKEALQAGIKAVEIEGNGIQVSVLINWLGASLLPMPLDGCQGALDLLNLSLNTLCECLVTGDHSSTPS